MPHIEILDVATSNRIAAGEVVERPASIIKELIENALDAHATAITVEVRGGGIDYARVTDNGDGFPPGEMRVAFERHATSKLRSGDALDRILTLGFRGEALPSIAAVARVELTSRQKGREAGMRLSIEGGHVLDIREAGCPEGTTLVVKDLFFNTPARRAFLKRGPTEAGYVGEAVLQLALSRHDVSFRFVNAGKTIFHTPGGDDLQKTLQVLFGREISAGLAQIRGPLPGGEVHGVLGLQDAARANRHREFFIVNGRVVRSQLLASALEEAVRGSIAPGRYPFCALFLAVPPEGVDVNVHPNKLEVRFRDEEGVRGALFGAVQESLRPAVAPRVPLLPKQKEETWKSRVEVATPPPYLATGNTTRLSESAVARPVASPPPAKPPEPPVVQEYRVTVEPPLPAPLTLETGEEPPRAIGVLFSTYILVERGEDFLLIDQHAAHERLLYEQLRREMDKGVASQPLLLPYAVDVTPRERERLLESLDALEAIGFSIEEFGPRTFRVTAVPHILGEPQLRDFFIDLLGQLEALSQIRVADVKRDAVARIACHKAVKGGDRLGDAELSHLLRVVMNEEIPLTCPHGRPILLRMTRGEIERRIRRTV